MSESTPYSPAFFSRIRDGSHASAVEVVPRLIQLLQPKSVVDVGCGMGTWADVFLQMGIEDVFGIDGEYLDRHTLLIPKERFIAANIGEPLQLNRRFDLVLSLEVAEHLPESCAAAYVANLVSLGDVVAFSAAIPGQGGTHHLNEQWPEYWKALFGMHGYELVDCLRNWMWHNENVERWYRQNLLLYVDGERLRRDEVLMQQWECNKNNILSIVHPASLVAASRPSPLQVLTQAIVLRIKKAFQ